TGVADGPNSVSRDNHAIAGRWVREKPMTVRQGRGVGVSIKFDHAQVARAGNFPVSFILSLPDINLPHAASLQQREILADAFFRAGGRVTMAELRQVGHIVTMVGDELVDDRMMKVVETW